MRKNDRLNRWSRVGWFTRWTACVVLAASLSIATTGVDAQAPNTDDATQIRVRELIYVLRQYRPFERADEWGGAIRELAMIGKPALPELLRELKHTEREQTLRAMLFALRAIDDPRALPFVTDEIPKAERLSNRFSDYGLGFINSELHRFMQENQNRPRTRDDEKDDSVTYGRPINEILGTLHKLSRTERGNTWKLADWNNWWKAQQSSGKAPKKDTSLVLEPRKDDLVERDGVRRHGVLFRTGPDQFLGPAVEVQLNGRVVADVPWALDMESGRLYEYLEGVRYGSEKKQDRLEFRKWLDQNRIDISGGDVHGIHLWLIANERWDSLDEEITSDKPLNIGREAFAVWERDNHAPGKGVGTFLFTTDEGSRGVMRVQYLEDEQATKFEYRLWSRREPIQLRARPEIADNKEDTWQPAKLVLLKEPDFDSECLFDFMRGKKGVLPRSAFDQSLPDMQSILKTRGAVFGEPRIAHWAKQQGIDLAAVQGTHITEGGGAPSS